MKFVAIMMLLVNCFEIVRAFPGHDDCWALHRGRPHERMMLGGYIYVGKRGDFIYFHSQSLSKVLVFQFL